MASVEPGKTYLGVTCRNCEKPVPFVEVEPGTKLGETAGDFEIVCPFCEHRDQYPPSAFRMMEAHYKH